jgi:hypothetical protein
MISRFTDLPPNLADLPVEARGYPVPYFVSKVKGEWEFRAVDPRKIEHADKHRLCWICGKRLVGTRKAFVIGPMCAVNRVSAEPPSHLTCARFAVVACPFLTRPMAKRRPMEGSTHKTPAGMMIERNPGVTLIWCCRDYRTQREPGGVLFRLGTPSRLEWYAEGREATGAEVAASIASGLPILQRQAQLDGPEALEALAGHLRRADRLLRLWLPA